jgi:hypothetical protein
MLFSGVAVSGIFSRTAATASLQQQADQAAGLVVRVVHPEKDSGMINLLRRSEVAKRRGG